MGFREQLKPYIELTEELIGSIRRLVSYLDQDDGDTNTPEAGAGRDIEIDLHRLRVWLEVRDEELNTTYDSDEVTPKHLDSLGGVLVSRGVMGLIPPSDIEKALECHRLQPWGTANEASGERGFWEIRTLSEHDGHLHSNHTVALESGDRRIEIVTRLSTRTFVFLRGPDATYDPDYFW